MNALEELLKDATAGDPITGLRWTKKTSHTLCRELQRQGYEEGEDTVRRLLKKGRYVLRSNRKRLSKKKDADRDRQMRYLVRMRKQHEKAGFPSISVDAKQRELIGNFKNPGSTYRRKPLAVRCSLFDVSPLRRFASLPCPLLASYGGSNQTT